jgi:hypothetical protein
MNEDEPSKIVWTKLDGFTREELDGQQVDFEIEVGINDIPIIGPGSLSVSAKPDGFFEINVTVKGSNGSSGIYEAIHHQTTKRLYRI